MNLLIDFIVNTVWDWGYIWIFILMAIDSTFIPFPSEIVMIPAWYLSSAWEMNFLLAFFYWTLWAIFWSIFTYFLWKHFWWPIVHKIVKKYWKYVFLSLEHYEKSEDYFKHHWAITVFIFRFLPWIRQLVSIPAWVFNMNFAKFLTYTFLWAWIWNLVLMSVWYIAWENKELISKYSKEAIIWVLVFVIIVWIIYYIKHKNKSGKK